MEKAPLPGSVSTEEEEAPPERAQVPDWDSIAAAAGEKDEDGEQKPESDEGSLLSDEEVQALLGGLTGGDVDEVLGKVLEAAKAKNKRKLCEHGALETLLGLAEGSFAQEKGDDANAGPRGMLALEIVSFLAKNDEGTKRAVQEGPCGIMAGILRNKDAGSGEAREMVSTIIGNLAGVPTKRQPNLRSLASRGLVAVLGDVLVEAERPSPLLSALISATRWLTSSKACISAMGEHGGVFKALVGACMEEGLLSKRDRLAALTSLWNASNIKETVQGVEASGAIGVALLLLQQTADYPNQSRRAAVGILHNLCRFNVLTHSHARGEEVLGVLSTWGEDQELAPNVSFVANITAALMVGSLDDKEHQALVAAGGCLSKLCRALMCTLEGKQCYGGKWEVGEVVQAMKSVAVNDENKRRLREEGVLPLLERALHDKRDEEEATWMCLQTLLLLSFDEQAREWMGGRAKDEGGTLWADVQSVADGGKEGLTEMSMDAGALLFRLRDYAPKYARAEEKAAGSQLSSEDESEGHSGGGELRAGIDEGRLAPMPASVPEPLVGAAPVMASSSHPAPRQSVKTKTKEKKGGDSAKLRANRARRAKAADDGEDRVEGGEGGCGGGGLGKHVMLSYSWAQKLLVKRLAEELRRAGIEVWRDEEGSRYAPPISGSTLEAMAAAIENAYAVVVCVSRSYRESGNCRLEAEYAHSFKQRGDLRMLFVMCESDYTTVSKPDRLSGWLGIMVGAELWYPCWAEDVAANAANSILDKLTPDSGPHQDKASKHVTAARPPPVQGGAEVAAQGKGAAGGGGGGTLVDKDVQGQGKPSGAKERFGGGEVGPWLAREGLEVCSGAFERNGLDHMQDVLELDEADVRHLLSYSIGLQKQLMRALKKLEGSRLRAQAPAQEAQERERLREQVLELERKVAGIQQTSSCCMIS